VEDYVVLSVHAFDIQRSSGPRKRQLTLLNAVLVGLAVLLLLVLHTLSALIIVVLQWSASSGLEAV
jgi:hypothetical protein